MTSFWHRNSGDLNEVLIDPAEDWSQAQWSRDHFPSRELIFKWFPRPNFEIAARGWPAGTPDFQRLIKKELNPSSYTVFYIEFESAVQIGPKPTQDPIFTIFLNFFFLYFLGALGGSADWAQPF